MLLKKPLGTEETFKKKCRTTCIFALGGTLAEGGAGPGLASAAERRSLDGSREDTPHLGDAG